MIAILALGLLAMSVYLVLQALASVLAARYFARAAKRPLGPKPWRAIFLQFSILMIVLIYARVSTDGQSLASQDAQLHAAGCANFYRDSAG